MTVQQANKYLNSNAYTFKLGPKLRINEYCGQKNQ